MKKTLNVGIFGIGHAHADNNIGAMKKTPGVKIVGMCEPNGELIEAKRRNAADIYGDIPVMSENELLGAGLDAALIESVVPDLTPLAAKCVDAGLHVQMDKPAWIDLSEYKRILDKAKANGLAFHTGYMYRYNGGFREIVRSVKSGELGDVYNIYAQMCTEHTVDERKRFASYGVPQPINYIFGCHLLDLILLILGEPKRVEAFGASSGKDGLDLEDTTVVVLEYEKGVATYKVSSVEINGANMREFTVAGSKRTISLRPIEPAAMAVTDAGKYWSCVPVVTYPDSEFPEARGRRYDLMMLDFVRAARGEDESEFSYEHEYLLQKYLMLTCGVGI